MPTLKTLLEERAGRIDTNIEAGIVQVFKPQYNIAALTFCWIAPSAGEVVVEIWGGSGSGGSICCCGWGLAGNAGAYSKKTTYVSAGFYICGCVGQGGLGSTQTGSCCGSCGCATGVGIFNSSGGQLFCMCAQPGGGGHGWCTTSTAGWCCFYAAGYCGTCIASGCGIICNVAGPRSMPECSCAFGGDINLPGTFSRRFFQGCGGGFQAISCVPYSPGIIGCRSGYVITCMQATMADTTPMSWSAMAAGKRSTGQLHLSCCFQDYITCEAFNCRTTGKDCHLGWGMPGGDSNTCAGFGGYSVSGGSGMARIRFIS